MLGPRIVACGPILDGPQPSNPPLSVSVHNAEDARQTVRSLASLGADCIKVHDGIPREAYFALADEAKQRGLPLVGHVPVRVRTLDAVRAGQRSIEHQIGLRGASTVETEFMRAEEKDDVFAEAMRSKNFHSIPEATARKGYLILDGFSEKRARERHRAPAANRIYLVPTLVTGRALTFVDELSVEEDPRAKYVPAQVREWWKPEKEC